MHTVDTVINLSVYNDISKTIQIEIVWEKNTIYGLYLNNYKAKIKQTLKCMKLI